MKKVYAPGVFDLFHIGHLNYLKTASTAGDYLVVAIQEDRTVEKAKNIKLSTPLAERMALIEELRFVNEVISYIDTYQGPILKELNINIFACGEDYGSDPNFPRQKDTLEFCENNNIEIFRIPRTNHVSSTATRERLKMFWSKRAEKIDELPSGVTVLGSFDGDQEKIRQETIYEAEQLNNAVKNSNEKSLLDLGCGDGRLLIELAPKFAKITGVDFSQELIDITKTKIKNKNFDIKLITGDASEYKEDTAFDVILLSGIIPYLDDGQYLRMLKNIEQISNNKTQIFIRCSLSLKDRINVVNLYSKNLNDIYTAYYRTFDELIVGFNNHGWKKIQSKLLYQNNPETAVYWIELAKTELSQ
jgi:glycerol-3-phosphate cytidylyltransferase